jgi:AraC-like DNA-binding protein
MFVSTSTLSRIYKKHTGIYFADFVNQVRLHSAMLQLMYTDSSLTRIALENGFSGASVFSQSFRKAYGCSPSEYRSRHLDTTEKEQRRKEQQEHVLLQELAERSAFAGPGEETADLTGPESAAKGPDERQDLLISARDAGTLFSQKWNEVINIGSFYDAALANIQYHILYLQENLHFRYVRLWNVFSGKMQIIDENAPGNYNFDKTGIPDMKVCVSEWNHTISDRNILNDSSFRAAYFVENLSRIRNGADLICIMTGSDWISSYTDFTGIADGGIGLLTKDTIGKPGFYALQLMEHMGDYLVLEKEHVLITRKKGKDYFILCSNMKWFSQRYFLSGEDIRLEDDPLNVPGTVFSDLKPLELNITVADLEPGREYSIRKRRIRDGEGSILGEWKKLGYDRELTGQDIRYLRTSCYPRMELVKKTADPEKGVLSIAVTLEANEVALIHLY